MTNKENPKEKAYYQHLADLIRIYWEHYTQRLAMPQGLGGISLLYLPLGADVIAIPEQSLRGDGNIVQKALERSLVGHWQQFCSAMGYPSKHPENYTRFLEPLPEESIPFVGIFTQELCSQIAQEGPQITKAPAEKNEYFVEDIVERGLLTGVLFCIYFGLYSEQLPPQVSANNAATLLSKVNIGGLGCVARDLGLSNTSPVKIPPDYTSYFGHNMTKEDCREALRGQGLGESIGCPAGLQPSKACREFLASCGVQEIKGSVIGDLMTYIQRNIKPINAHQSPQGRLHRNYLS